MIRRKSRQRLPRHLRQRPGEFDPRRPAADDHERHPRPPPGFIRLALGDLERHQDLLPDVQRVPQALQARRMLGPLVVAEIRVGRARRDDQDVIIEAAVGQQEPLAGDIHAGGLGQHDGDVRLMPEDPPDRRGDVGGAERGRGHLVEQGLEQVVVRPVHDRDPHRRTSQPAHGGQAAESAADDHDVRSLGPWHPRSSSWCPVRPGRDDDGDGHGRRVPTLPWARRIGSRIPGRTARVGQAFKPDPIRSCVGGGSVRPLVRSDPTRSGDGAPSYKRMPVSESVGGGGSSVRGRRPLTTARSSSRPA